MVPQHALRRASNEQGEDKPWTDATEPDVGRAALERKGQTRLPEASLPVIGDGSNVIPMIHLIRDQSFR